MSSIWKWWICRSRGGANVNYISKGIQRSVLQFYRKEYDATEFVDIQLATASVNEDVLVVVVNHGMNLTCLFDTVVECGRIAP